MIITLNCFDCVYWAATNDLIGQCRRHAPASPEDTTGRKVETFPLTRPRCWCGDAVAWEDGADDKS